MSEPKTLKKRRKRFYFFRFLGVLFAGLSVLGLWQYELLIYASGQAYGQFRILYGARHCEELLRDPLFPDSLKQKIEILQEVRIFAHERLGLTPSDNYTKIYDQKGKAVLWVVTASEPFALQEKTWSFPIAGEFSYKGFFEQAKADSLAAQLKREGWDTGIREVSAWSTLGWFEDPLLSENLRRSEGGLANLIIHELTHATIFVKDSIALNENLANFTADKGAVLFLKNKYGENSDALREYENRKADRKKLNAFILKAAEDLDTFYNSLPPKLGFVEKRKLKDEKMQQIKAALDTVSFSIPAYREYFSAKTPNNTLFLSFRRYNGQHNNLERLYKNKYNENFTELIEDFKKRYKAL